MSRHTSKVCAFFIFFSVWSDPNNACGCKSAILTAPPHLQQHHGAYIGISEVHCCQLPRFSRGSMIYLDFNDTTWRSICPIRQSKYGDIRFELLPVIVPFGCDGDIKGVKKTLSIPPITTINNDLRMERSMACTWDLANVQVQVFIQKVSRLDGQKATFKDDIGHILGQENHSTVSLYEWLTSFREIVTVGVLGLSDVVFKLGFRQIVQFNILADDRNAF